jgi:beta-glucosidase-like glycosyl hydrolase
LGFNLNFAPVAEFSDEVYGGRAFQGTKEEVKEKLSFYIKGLQENIAGTCKHYPGKGMINNLHIKDDEQIISKEDLELFDVCFNNNILGVMVGHQIVTGELDSNGMPSSVSKEIIFTIDDSVLIIADEINMAGLKNFYSDKTELYVDLINSGENVILDFKLNPISMYKLIGKLEEEVEEGNINEDNVDESVKKILMMKGYVIK